MRARPLSTRAAALLVVMLLVTACRGGADPEPTGSPPPDPADPEPVTLRITHIELAPMGNSEILVGTGEDVDVEAAEAAVEAVRTALQRWLNAQFVDPSTRFTSAPARALLRPGVFDGLPPEQRAAMGVQYQPVTGLVPGTATGEATVLFENGRAYAVSVDYRLDVELRYPEAESAGETATASEPADDAPVLSHNGTVVFTAPSWAVESFEFRTKAPDVPVPTPSTTPASTTSGATS